MRNKTMPLLSDACIQAEYQYERGKKERKRKRHYFATSSCWILLRPHIIPIMSIRILKFLWVKGTSHANKIQLSTASRKQQEFFHRGQPCVIMEA
jgi:hypothetical protein